VAVVTSRGHSSSDLTYLSRIGIAWIVQAHTLLAAASAYVRDEFRDKVGLGISWRRMDGWCRPTRALRRDRLDVRSADRSLAELYEVHEIVADIWDSCEQELERVLDAGDKGVVALLRFRAKGRSSGAPVEFPWAAVYTLRNGRIVTTRAFTSQDDALKAVGLEE
jgi:ketosteroid isomerase-like protein